ncbi:YciI family protein [Rhodococcus erythropolis]|uniref:YciI family protein n=1 Tax=Rhodococcus erythropolis TaxID=1833 RepID=UPI00380C3F50
MFIISGTYTRQFERTEPVVAEHLSFLERCYDDNTFVASGPRKPFTGGLIIARGDDEDSIRQVMQEDPFVREGIAEYEYLQFTPTKAAHSDLIEQ